MTALEDALDRIEATTDMGDFGAGLLHAAGVIREAIAIDALPKPDDSWEHIWIEGEPLNVVLDSDKDYVLHFTGRIPEGSSIRGGRNVVWLGSTS